MRFGVEDGFNLKVCLVVLDVEGRLIRETALRVEACGFNMVKEGNMKGIVNVLHGER